MIRKNLLIMLSIFLMSSLCFAGGQEESSTNNSSSDNYGSINNSETEQTFIPFTVTTYEQEVTYDHVPKRAVSLNAHTTEIMLAMGLGDVMVGTSYNNAPVLPEYQEEFRKIPQLADKYPSLEVFLNADPDFVFGRSSAFNEKSVASLETILDYGIMAYVCKGSYTVGTTMEDVYKDFQVIGRVFQVEERADEIVQGMKARIDSIQKKIGKREPLRVFVLDATGDTAFTACRSLQTSLIEAAGGENIFDDIDKVWASVSWEEVVERNPEVIVINEYGNTPASEKIAFAKSLPAMIDVDAVKNDRFVIVELPAVFPGIRNADTVEQLAEAFYPELF